MKLEDKLGFAVVALVFGSLFLFSYLTASNVTNMITVPTEEVQDNGKN